MRSIALLCVMCCSSALLTGCANVVPSTPDAKPDSTVKVESTALFSVLADLVPGKITDLETLRRVLVIHNQNGWISDSDVQKFDGKFSGSNRQLTSDDAATLRGLK